MLHLYSNSVRLTKFMTLVRLLLNDIRFSLCKFLRGRRRQYCVTNYKLLPIFQLLFHYMLFYTVHEMCPQGCSAQRWKQLKYPLTERIVAPHAMKTNDMPAAPCCQQQFTVKLNTRTILNNIKIRDKLFS
jgi:hypothetical protein